MRLARRSLVVGLLLGGCRGGGPPPACDGVAGLTVTRVVEHPGGGGEVTMRLAFATGVPIAEADLVQCLSIEGAAGQTSVARRPVEAAFTLLLVDPGNNQRANEAARGLVQAIVKKRPAADAIGIFRWGAAVTQVAPFHSDRRLLLERLPALLPSEGVAPAADALAAAAGALAAVGGPARDALRTIILVSPRGAATMGLGPALERARPHLVLWIGGSDQDRQLAALPAGQRFPMGAQAVPAAVVSALSDRMEAYQRHGHYVLGLCGQAEQPLRLLFQGGQASTLTLPAATPENRAGACKAEDIAQGRRVFPARLELLFTAEERSAAQAAFLDRVRRPSFALAVRAGGDPVRATGRFSGEASYGCTRRSYSLELEGQAPRFWFPGSAGRRFELQAMCLDRLYLRTFTLLRLLADEGLFPVPVDLIELSIDGASQGPYLIFEEVTDAMRARASGLKAVVQRRSAGAEVRWSAGAGPDAQASYDRILGAATGLAGRPLEAALSDRFDLQSYLTWVALVTLVDSGGSSGENLFYATDTTAPDGSRADYHLVMGWDDDDLGDLFTGCRAGARAVVDPRGLLGCAETELDRRIFSDQLLYARYAEVLSSALERHPGERFAARARETATRVLAFLERPEVRAGSVELQAIDGRAPASFEVTRQLLEDELALLIAQFEHRRATLEERLARFRGER